MKLEGRNAVVIGAASGIGRAVAEAFATEGARVCLADIDESARAAAVPAIGADATAVVMDVAERSGVDPAVAEIDRQTGINPLVNGAGEYALEPWLEIDVATWDRVFAVNARSMMRVTQAVARTMVARGRGGNIINIASAAGRRDDPNSVAYSASKAAAISLTQFAALGLARHRIRVNAIAPGLVNTPM